MNVTIWLELLLVGIPDFQNVWCLNIISNFLIALIPIFLQLSSANPASYTGIETLTSSWLPNNVWVEEELNSNLNLLQRKFRRKQGKILNRKIYSQEVSILGFRGTLFYSLKGSQCLYCKAEQTLNTAFDTVKLIVLSKKGKKMWALHRVFPTFSIVVLKFQVHSSVTYFADLISDMKVWSDPFSRK